MAIEFYEKFGSRQTTDEIAGRNASARLLYIGVGDAGETEDVMRDALKLLAPTDYANLTARSYALNKITPKHWDCVVRYAFPDDDRGEAPPDTGESVFNFDTTGGTFTIRQAVEHISDTGPAGETPTNHQGAINVTPDGVEGVEIEVAGLVFSETHYIADSMVDLDYVRTLRDLTKKTNNAAWRGFAKGELFFRGARGSRRGRGDWEIEFSFTSEKNLADVPGLAPIQTVAKEGHQYLWVEYHKVDDDPSNRLTSEPLFAHVERVYEEGDFLQLGIGS